MAFKLPALHSRATEVTVGIKVGDIVDGVTDLLDLVVARAPDMEFRI